MYDGRKAARGRKHCGRTFEVDSREKPPEAESFKAKAVGRDSKGSRRDSREDFGKDSVGAAGTATFGKAAGATAKKASRERQRARQRGRLPDETDE